MAKSTDVARTPDSGPPSTEALTVRGLGPQGVDTGNDGERPADVVERAALQRALSRLVPEDYAPVRLGRFVLLEPIATGGMGVVHAGYDDMLDRKVALKLIRADRTSEAARARLLREAQAMAKLSHPNVVQVFEAGAHEGQVYLAMEFVEGLTLRGWLREQTRSVAEILAMFSQIGQGLAAAHDAGVLHRDFKPDNVLVTRDGRPKVADFGLAALDPRAETSSASASMSGIRPELRAAASLSSSTGPAAASSSAMHEPLTMTGEVMGTPAYMSIEQWRGQACDAASDQFSFCVALFEALWGARPFAGDSSAEVMRNVAAGRVRGEGLQGDAPAWLRAVIVQGLAADPQRRHPDMRALLAALDADPIAARRRRWWRIAVTAAVTGGMGLGVAAWVARPRPCRDAEDRIDAALDEAGREAIAAALRATATPFAEDTASRVDRRLTDYRGRWVQGYREACEATHVRGVQSATLLDLRVACLERARRSLRSTAALMTTADAALVEHAIQLVEHLPEPEACADVEALQARVPPPADPELAARVTALEDELARVVAIHVAGRADEAEPQLAALFEQAREVGHPPVVAEVGFRWGQALTSVSRDVEAEAVLRAALEAALAVGDDATATSSASLLALMLGNRDSRFAEAQWLLQVAKGVATHSGKARLLGEAHNSIGGMLERQGHATRAVTEFRTAIDLLTEAYGPDDPMTAAAHENLAVALASAGQVEPALAELGRVIELRELAFGEGHPLLGKAYTNLGATLNEARRFDEGEAALRHGLSILEATLDDDHPDVVNAHLNLAVGFDERQQRVAAQAEYRRAIESLERQLGREHPDVARAYNNLGASLEDDGRLTESEQTYRHALAISLATLDPDHPDVARTRGNLASVLSQQGRHAEAVVEAEASLAASLRRLAPDDPDILAAFAVLGRVQLARARASSDREQAAFATAAAVAAWVAAGPEGHDALAEFTAAR